MSQLRQGMYVNVKRLSDHEIYALTEAFEAAGAVVIETENFRQKKYPYLIWGCDDTVWCSSDPHLAHDNPTEVTPEFVMGIKYSQAGPVEPRDTLTLRDQFALAVDFPGDLSLNFATVLAGESPEGNDPEEWLEYWVTVEARWRYKVADALLEERNQQRNQK